MSRKTPKVPESKSIPLLGDVLHLLGLVVFERTESGSFILSSPSKGWLVSLLGIDPTPGKELLLTGCFDFLDCFLSESREIWGNSESEWRKSGVWTEKTVDQILHLEATALAVAGRNLLLLENLTEKYRERSELLQKARENVLNYQRLVREIEGNEILLHCIVHDLSGPLMGIETCLSWFEREDLSEPGHRRLRTGQKAAAKLRAQIDEILAVFAVENSEPGNKGKSSLSVCARSTALTVIEILQPTAQLRNIEIALDATEQQDWTVIGEKARLERVLFNLLDNALRHAPEDSQIRLTLNSRDDEIHCSVADEGPGVLPADEKHLFRKLLRVGENAGKAGLGLYFCRIVVERWGGRIGYNSLSPRGACFWFCLPRAKER